MSRLYITGDTHGEIDVNKLSKKYFERYEQGFPYFKKGDFLVILGDFGFPFLDIDIMKKRGKYNEYNYWCKWLSELPCTILVVDGNHDNHNFWDSKPISEAFGGKVHKHPDIKDCYHLMRGEVYEIVGYKCLTFGGAASVDKAYRIPNFSWWERETASKEEFENALKNLKKVDNLVDLVFSHTMPMSLIRANGYSPIPDDTANYLDVFYNNANGKDDFGGVDFKKWYCGHFHENKVMGKKITCLYDRFDVLPEKGKRLYKRKVTE